MIAMIYHMLSFLIILSHITLEAILNKNTHFPSRKYQFNETLKKLGVNKNNLPNFKNVVYFLHIRACSHFNNFRGNKYYPHFI